MVEINEIIVSAFRYIKDTKHPDNFLLMDVLETMRNPPTELKQKISEIRKAPEKEQGELKIKLLPLICPSGIFSERADDKLIKMSPAICLDLDNVKDQDTVRRELSGCENVLATFTSPTGTGLKVIILHDLDRPELNPALYNWIGSQLHLTGRSDLKFDPHCGNISRACFVSCDKDMYLNPEAKPMNVDPGMLEGISVPKTHATRKDKSSADNPTLITPLTDPEKIKEIIVEEHELFERFFPMYPGVRNANLYRLASFFHDAGIPEETAASYLSAYYGQDGFEVNEIITTVKSAYRK